MQSNQISQHFSCMLPVIEDYFSFSDDLDTNKDKVKDKGKNLDIK